MARRTLNRRELRAAAEAAEAREKERDDDETEDEEEDEEDDEGDDDEDESEVEDSGDEDEEEPRPKKVKKPAKTKAKPAAKSAKRARAGKVTRQRIVWTVFNNSHQPVARFDYPRRSEADALAAKLTTDKKSTHFVQAIKEPMEDKALGK
jgi:hypothetical protein